MGHSDSTGAEPHFCACEAGSPTQAIPLATVESTPRIDTGKSQVLLSLGHHVVVASQAIALAHRTGQVFHDTSPPASYVVNCAFLR